MSLDRRPSPYAVRSARKTRRLMPKIYLRFRLRLVNYEIARLERQLEGEFATEQTQPLLQRLHRLVEEKAVLLRRLAEG